MHEPVKTTCPYCGVGCGLLASVDDDGIACIKGDPDHPANRGRLCSKGSALGETTYLQDRLLYPIAHSTQVSWEQALAEVAGEFSKAIAAHGPDSVAFYVSGQLLTEDYYVANKLMKGAIGSGNIDTNSRLCMSSAVAAHKRAFGEDCVPGCYGDLEQARLIVLAGSNAAWCHPVLYQRIVQAKSANPDLKIVVIDPRHTQTADIADLHLAIRPGMDGVLWNGLLAALSASPGCDEQFVSAHTSGRDEALAAATSSAGTISQVAESCGLDEGDVARFYRLFTDTEQTVTLFSQGINQSRSGSDKGNAIINCHLITGRIGRPGMGPFSLTGQPNAMGGREVGGLANQLAAHMEIADPAHRSLVQRFWNSPVIAGHEGLKAVDLFEAVHRGQIKALWIMATNPVVSMPDADRVREAIKACEFTVISDCVAATDTARLCDIRLPALTWGERDGTVTNSERCISRQRPFLSAPGLARPDWQIITQVARLMGHDEMFPYQSVGEIFKEHAALSGFENEGARQFDISGLSAISTEAYAAMQPVQWPLRKGEEQGTERLFADGAFSTPNGKARFIPVTPRPPMSQTSKNWPFTLNTGRMRDHWHTMTRTGVSPRLSAHSFEPNVQINPEDAAAQRLKDGGLARITSGLGEILCRVQLSDRQQKGSLFIPMHWSDHYAAMARVNTLVSPDTDPVSGQPESKGSFCAIAPYHPLWQGFALSRRQLEMNHDGYWVRARAKGLWRYELANHSMPRQELEHFARQLLCTPDDEVNWIDYWDKGAGLYRGARFVGAGLESCLFISHGAALPSPDWLMSLFAKEKLSPSERAALMSGRPPTPVEDQGRIICSCFNVGEKAIMRAVAEGSANTAEDIGAHLKAGTNCGSCLPEINALVSAGGQPSAA